MIKLDDIIEALELDFNDSNYFYDVANSCVVMITDEEFGYAEDEKRFRIFQNGISIVMKFL